MSIENMALTRNGAMAMGRLDEHVNKLLEMAEHFKATGERELEQECRNTATRILDYVLYVQSKGGR